MRSEKEIRGKLVRIANELSLELEKINRLKRQYADLLWVLEENFNIWLDNLPKEEREALTKLGF